MKKGVVTNVTDGIRILLDDGIHINWHVRGNLKLGDRVCAAVNYETGKPRFVISERNIPTIDETEPPSAEELLEINFDIEENSHAYYYRD